MHQQNNSIRIIGFLAMRDAMTAGTIVAPI